MGSTVLDKKGYLSDFNSFIANRQFMGCSGTSRDLYIGSNSFVSGDVFIKSPVYIGSGSEIKTRRGSSIFIGPRTNIHDNCRIHGQSGRAIRALNINWGIYIEADASILHGSRIDGYCRIGRNTFVGQEVSISNAEIMSHCVIMHRVNITGGIIIPEKRFIKPGSNIFTQRDADNLPRVPKEYISLNPDTVRGYMELMAEYLSSSKRVKR